MQVPLLHASFMVHALESLQAEPLGLAGLEQMPDEVSHVPATWHWSDAVHTTGLEPTQLPDWQLSVSVHALLSLHEEPSATLAVLHFAPPPTVDVHTAFWH